MTGNDISAQVDDPALLQCTVVDIPIGTIVDYLWRRADMSSISGVISNQAIYFPYVGVSDAGVYICEVNVSDPTNYPNVTSQSGSVNITFTVTGKYIVNI